eukprot:s2186_g10.t1
MTSCGIEAPDVAKAADLTKVSMTPPKDKAIRKDVPQFGPSADISTVAECIHDVATQDDDGKISYNAPGTVALVDDGAYDVPIQSSMGREATREGEPDRTFRAKRVYEEAASSSSAPPPKEAAVAAKAVASTVKLEDVAMDDDATRKGVVVANGMLFCLRCRAPQTDDSAKVTKRFFENVKIRQRILATAATGSNKPIEALLTSDPRNMGDGSKKRGGYNPRREGPSPTSRKAQLLVCRAMEDMQKFDYLSYAVLPDPGRSEEQRHCRAGSHYTSDGLFNFGIGPAKLVFYAHCEVEPLRSLKLIDETSLHPKAQAALRAVRAAMLCQDGAKVNSRCVLLAVGVILSLVVYGLLQERIMTESYNNQVFDSAVFLVFCNRSLGVLCGMLAVLWQKEPLRSGAPVWKYAIVSFSNVFASSCQYEALKYVSFTVQMLGKSFKMIPVMLWGIIIDGKSYSVQDWIVAAVITGGVVEFLIMGPTTSHRLQHAPEYDRPGYGYFLMVSFLALDGLTSSLQEKLFKEHQTTRSNQWLYVNACSCIITGLLLVAEGAFMPSLDFLFQHHVFATDTVVLSSSAVVSQFFIYAQVQEFGALAYAATMNARQARLRRERKASADFGPPQRLGVTLSLMCPLHGCRGSQVLKHIICSVLCLVMQRSAAAFLMVGSQWAQDLAGAKLLIVCGLSGMAARRWWSGSEDEDEEVWVSGDEDVAAVARVPVKGCPGRSEDPRPPLWEAPLGPPTPVMLALTDIDPESGQIGIHIQRLPARGTSHSWTLWTGSDDGPMAEAVSRTEQDVEAYESAGGGLPTNPTASSSSTSFPKAKAAPVPTRRPNIPKAVAKPSRHSMNANNARKWGLIFVCLCQP